MFIPKAQPVVSKAALALRTYLAQASQAELDARLARVKALQLPQSPTVADLRTPAVAASLASTACVAAAPQARYGGPAVGHNLSAEGYSYHMAA